MTWSLAVRRDGFFGNFGEVRVAAAALPPAQWLTAMLSVKSATFARDGASRVSVDQGAVGLPSPSMCGRRRAVRPAGNCT